LEASITTLYIMQKCAVTQYIDHTQILTFLSPETKQ